MSGAMVEIGRLSIALHGASAAGRRVRVGGLEAALRRRLDVLRIAGSHAVPDLIVDAFDSRRRDADATALREPARTKAFWFRRIAATIRRARAGRRGLMVHLVLPESSSNTARVLSASRSTSWCSSSTRSRSPHDQRADGQRAARS